MNPFEYLNDRRSFLKGVSLGAGGLLLAPLLEKVAATADGKVTPPKRVIFFTFDNGFDEAGALPEGISLSGTTNRQIPLKDLKLPYDLEPFAPFQDRMTILHGLWSIRGVDHGGFFTALSGSSGNKNAAQIQSIDAALGLALPSVFPLVALGIGGENTSYSMSAWGKGQPIGAICRPELAYQTLFGRLGAKQNDFAERKNLLDFVTGDVRRLQSEIAGPERELLLRHLEAVESLSKRQGLHSEKFESGALAKFAPKLQPAGTRNETVPAGSMTETVAAQCDLAAAALIAGLTNVVTINSGCGGLSPNYSGISNTAPHGLGHNDPDQTLKKKGYDVLSMYHNYLATQAAKLLARLKEIPEGTGTMFDNTVLVFTSDSANNQHSRPGNNWPFVLIGNLGGALKSGQFVAYPIANYRDLRTLTDYAQPKINVGDKNPLINALYCTLLHAVGKPRDTFNHDENSKRYSAERFGPLGTLLA
jgi:hypothetical protein